MASHRQREALLREAQTQYQAEDPWMQPLAAPATQSLTAGSAPALKQSQIRWLRV